MSSSNKVVAFDLMDPSLPAWNYSISGQTGSGKSILTDALLNNERLIEEMYKQKLEEDNLLFDHFIATGEVVNDPKEIK